MPRQSRPEFPNDFGPLRGQWVRYSDYVVTDDWIRPAPGAEPELYEPWDGYEEARRTTAVESPVEQLIRVVEDHSGSLEALMGWCQRFGLLGLLHHQTLAVVLAPRFRSPGAGFGPLGPGVDKAFDDVVVPELVTWSRSGNQWESRLAYGKPTSAASAVGGLVPTEMLPADWPAPGLFLAPLNGPPGWYSLTEWSRYFPDIDPALAALTEFALPPQRRSFWDAYAERTDDFLSAAALLRRALDEAGEGNVDRINSLVAPVSPRLVRRSGRWQQRWPSNPSLLSSLAMMAVQDLAENRRVLTCEVCGHLFTTAAYQALYCSRRCASTGQQRKYRQKRPGTRPASRQEDLSGSQLDS